MNVCSVCMKSYLFITTKLFHGAYACSHCIVERKCNNFSFTNNMELNIQSSILAVLTQVEEMLICCVNPILQVTHTRGIKYKYYIHTIIFPQDICNISTSLPHLISNIDILFVHKCNPTENPYEFFVSRTCVLDAIEYKMSNDPYYKDIRANLIALSSFTLE